MNLQDLRKKDIIAAKADISASLGIDNYIIQMVAHIEDLDSVLNKLVKRFRDWYELVMPELSRAHHDHSEFIKLAVDMTRKEGSMGRAYTHEDLAGLEVLRSEIAHLYVVKDEQIGRLEGLMEREYPNTCALAGGLLAAKLIRIAGSMKKFMIMPASTVQTLGAEKALFRHLRSGAKSPKYGLLLAHPYVAEGENKGKNARSMADKIALAAKVDYFKGDFVGDKLKESLR